MKTKLQKIGNSTGVIIPAHLLKKLNLKAGVAVEVKEKNNSIVIEPIEEELTLKNMLALCTKENTALSEEDKAWLNAKPVGKEI